MTHFNQLTPAQLERLALLSEELGEAQQAIGKILRHGYESTHPHHYTPGTNRQELEHELGDVRAAIDILTNCGDLKVESIHVAKLSKLHRVAEYLHHTTVYGE